MKCAWDAYINLLPLWMRKEVDSFAEGTLQELRLRIDRPPEFVGCDMPFPINRQITADDLSYCINTASRYSPWASTTVADGYITAQGGHRLGICGDVINVNGKLSTITNVTSLCIRVARDFHGIGIQAKVLQGSILIIGSPGTGKTTLLRDIIRHKAMDAAVAVVDERRELFPTADGKLCFPSGLRTEVLSGCNKTLGVQMLIRTMNPKWLAVDEITAEEDCNALIHAAYCGVSLMATAHAENLNEFMQRPVYKPLISQGIFKNYIVMQPDKSWTLERMNI